MNHEITDRHKDRDEFRYRNGDRDKYTELNDYK